MEAEAEELVFKVSASGDPQALATAIARGLDEGSSIVLKSIGSMALVVAVKAVCLANTDLVARGMVIFLIPFFGERVSNADNDTTISPLCLRLSKVTIVPQVPRRGR